MRLVHQVFQIDQAPQPFKGAVTVEPFHSLDYEGWRASVVVDDRQFFDLGQSREAALIGLAELLAEHVS